MGAFGIKGKLSEINLLIFELKKMRRRRNETSRNGCQKIVKKFSESTVVQVGKGG